MLNARVRPFIRGMPHLRLRSVEGNCRERVYQKWMLWMPMRYRLDNDLQQDGQPNGCTADEPNAIRVDAGQR